MRADQPRCFRLVFGGLNTPRGLHSQSAKIFALLLGLMERLNRSIDPIKSVNFTYTFRFDGYTHGTPQSLFFCTVH